MSEVNDRPTPDALEDATGALRGAPVPAGPSTELSAATVAAIQTRLAGAPPASELARRRRRKIMRYIGFGTATAAAVAVATAAGILWFGGSAAAHVQKAIDNAEKATSVKVTMTIENKGKVEVRTLYRQGDAVRVETAADATLPDNPIMVVDLKTRKLLTLLPGTKGAARGELAAQEAQAVAGMLGDFAGLKTYLGGDDKAVKALGEEKIGDRKTTAYEITAAGPIPGVWKVWVDPKTDLPVRLRLAGEAKQSLTFDFEDWNKKFDAKLFSQDVPEGYTLPEVKK